MPAVFQAFARRLGRVGLLRGLCMLVAAPLLLLMVAAFVNTEAEFRGAEQSALKEASGLARKAVGQLEVHFDDVNQVLAAVSEIARDTLIHGTDSDARLLRVLSAMPTHVNGLSILSPDGRFLATTTAKAGVDASVRATDRTFFKDALARRSLAVSEPLLTRTNMEWAIIAARPVLGDDGAPIGVVTMGTRIDGLQNVLLPLSLPAGARLAVFNDRGTGIYGSLESVETIGRDFTKSPGVRRALQERAFSARIEASDGQTRLTAYARGERLPWIVEVGLSLDTTLAPAKDRRVFRVAYLLLALALGLALTYWMAGWLADPIRAMARDAEKLGGGDLAVRTTVAGYREVRQLGTAFNAMAQAIAANQRELEASEERFRSLVFLSSDRYWTQDTDYRFLSHTQGGGGEGALSAEDIRGKARWEIPGAEPVGTTWEAHRALLDARQSWRDLTVRYVDAQGKEQYITSSGEPVFDEHGVFAGYRGVARRVINRFRLEAEVRERVDLFRITLDTTPVAIGLIRRRDNAVLISNRAGYAMFNVDPDAGAWNVLTHWERQEDLAEMVRRIKAEGAARDMEVPVHVPGRERLWVQLSAQPARYGGDEVLVVSVLDITERKQLESQREALLTDLRSANERLQLLSRRVLDVQEAERRQIAHELHDEIGQNLSALKLFAGHMRARLTPAQQKQVDEWIEIVNGAIMQVRDLSRMLRPIQLDHMGLIPALRALLDTQARASGWSVDFAADDNTPRIDMRLETVAYRVVQEALTNTARHAKAARVTLEVYVERTDHSGKLALRVADDGCGFDLIAVRKRVQEGMSMGMLGMEERVRLMGGSFSVQSAPGRGTQIMVTIPFALA